MSSGPIAMAKGKTHTLNQNTGFNRQLSSP